MIMILRLIKEVGFSPCPPPLPPGWSEELVFEAWDKNPQAACEKAGVDHTHTGGRGDHAPTGPSSFTVHKVGPATLQPCI